MSTLIFDIETAGEDWDELDEVTQTVLLRWVHKTARTPDEVATMTQDIKNGLGFSPLTGTIVALGVYDLERDRGVVYYVADAGERESEIGNFICRPRTEAELLVDFWQGATSYDTFVTFNGRAFDVPFLAHRSVVHGIRPTKNLLEGRYPYQQKLCRHVDLQDELTFFGAMTRRPNLHLFCRAYGITSPKGEVSGDDVAELFRQKKFRDIAEYNAADVVATTELYKRWRQYLDFSSPLPDISY